MPHERVMRVWGVAALLAGASATTPASEVAALRDFYGALGGDGWLDSHHWNSTRDPCSGSELWYGITCSDASSSGATHVVGIALESNQLDGTLPASLADLPRLRALDLGSNQVAGTTPDAICALRELETLELRSNSMSGTIPSCLANCTELSVIDYTYNSAPGLSGTVPVSLCALRGLGYFGLQYTTGLTGLVPDCFGVDQPNLYTLALEGNQLTGPIPSSICNASSLVYLLLYENHLTGPIPRCLGDLSQLQWLQVRARCSPL